MRLQIMSAKLTDKLLQSFHRNPPEKKNYIRESQGFTVRRMPGGSVTFLHIYTIAGKRRENVLGHYPETDLATARKRHRESLTALDAGIDPQSVVSLLPVSEVLTVEKLCNDWLDNWSKRHHTPRVHYNNRKALEAGIGQLANRSAADIRKSDAVTLLEQKAKTTPVQAQNLCKALRGAFQYAVDRELLEYNPFFLPKTSRVLPKQKSRERVVSDEEIRILWESIEQGGGSEGLKRCLKLILITGQRPGEVAAMHTSEIEYGAGKELCKTCRNCGWWTIPADRRQGNKGGLHRVFLSSLAMSVIGGKTGAVCPGVLPGESITANAVAYHVRRRVPGTGKVPYYGLDRWTPHDLRRTCGTGVRKLGASRDEMDLILGHRTLGVTGVYDRYTGTAEKQKWLQVWSDHLEQLIK